MSHSSELFSAQREQKRECTVLLQNKSIGGTENIYNAFECMAFYFEIHQKRPVSLLFSA